MGTGSIVVLIASHFDYSSRVLPSEECSTMRRASNRVLLALAVMTLPEQPAICLFLVHKVFWACSNLVNCVEALLLYHTVCRDFDV